MHKAIKIGTWAYPHPDPDLAARGAHVNIDLYDRPGDEAKPPPVIIRWMDDEGKPQSREEPFHEPILGAAHRCAGCGEPFGQQTKLRRNEWASICGESFVTDLGLMHFCQDQYACSRRAADRVPSYQEILTTKVLEELREETSGHNDEGRTAVCADDNCKRFFKPTKVGQRYHTGQCRVNAGSRKTKQAKKAAKPATKEPAAAI